MDEYHGISIEDEIIFALSSIGSQYDAYEYGLPYDNDDEMAKMRSKVKEIINCRLTNGEADATHGLPKQ